MLGVSILPFRASGMVHENMRFQTEIGDGNAQLDPRQHEGRTTLESYTKSVHTVDG